MPARKHHYIPRFYLRQWTGQDGKLCEFSRRPHGMVAVRRHPSQTGYDIDLYTVPTLPADQRDVVETRFFGPVDQHADEALRIFLSGGVIASARHQDGWSRFLMSLLQRHPARVAEIRDQAARTYRAEIVKHAELYEQMRGPDDPSFEEYLHRTDADSIARLSGKLLQRFSDLPNLGEHLNRMIRQVVHVRGHRWPMLTSDRPLITSNGLAKPDAFIILPIGPDHLFVATNTAEIAQRINDRIVGGEMLQRINDAVVRQAHRWVYAQDDRQLRFVANRIGPFQA